MADGGLYEKLSIRDSAKSLKKYGSTCKHIKRTDSYIKHVVSSSDTLQGIALKYGVTMEQIRRANRLWASDSLFLREYLLIPSGEGTLSPVSPLSPEVEGNKIKSPTSPQPVDFSEEGSIDDFLVKIDMSIANTKEEVKKTQGNSEFSSDGFERRKPAISRMKQAVNNNHTVVVSQGRKVKTSLQRLERQQDEMFEL